MKRSRIAWVFAAAILAFSIALNLYLDGRLAELRGKLREAEHQLALRPVGPARLVKFTPRETLAKHDNSVGNPEKIPSEQTPQTKVTETEEYVYHMKTDPVYGPFHADVRPPLSQERITAEDLERLNALPAIEAGDYLFKLRLLVGQEAVIDSGWIKATQPIKLESIKEFPYPTAFHPPQATGTSEDRPALPSVVPTTPKTFEFRNTGWTVQFQASATGGMLLINGVAENVAFESFTDAGGEYSMPIYDKSGVLLSDNRRMQPMFTSRETPVLIELLPGKTYRTKLNSADKSSILEITSQGAGQHGK